MADNYEYDFTRDKPNLTETIITGGLANATDHLIKGGENGWYCRATDPETGVHYTYFAMSQQDAKEGARRHLKDHVKDHIETQYQEANKRKYQEQPKKPLFQSTDTSENALKQLLIKVVAGALIIAAAVWLLLAVALPLMIINLAAIALIAGLMQEKGRKYLFPLSLVAASFLILDFNKGWFTLALGKNVPFLKGVIPFLYALNIVAALSAAYFLIRDYLNNKSAPLESEKELSKRNLIVIGSLVGLALIIGGGQYYFSGFRGAGAAPPITTMASVAPVPTPVVTSAPPATPPVVVTKPTVSPAAVSSAPLVRQHDFVGKWLGGSGMSIEVFPDNSNNFKVTLCFEDGCEDYIGTLQGNGTILCAQGQQRFIIQKKGDKCISAYMNNEFCKK